MNIHEHQAKQILKKYGAVVPEGVFALDVDELIEKAKLLSKKSEDEIARGCGYVGPSGRILRKSFYRALIEAKGFKIGNGRQGKNGNRASRGRQTEFKTKVHGNGNLLIGHAYTNKLGLEPGQEF